MPKNVTQSIPIPIPPRSEGSSMATRITPSGAYTGIILIETGNYNWLGSLQIEISELTFRMNAPFFLWGT